MKRSSCNANGCQAVLELLGCRAERCGALQVTYSSQYQVLVPRYHIEEPNTKIKNSPFFF